jgi:integrase
VVAISADLVRPSLSWLLSGATARSLIRNLAASRDSNGFARLRVRCDGVAEGSAATRTQVLYRSALIMAAKGGTLADITIGDVVELLDREAVARVNPLSGGALFYRVLHEMGILGEQAPATIRALRTRRQQTAAEMIDRYRIACEPVRDLLVDYLKERQPALDYTSLDSLANFLGKLFWADIEAHHPGIDTLHLPVGVADAWKRRLRTFTKKTTTATGETTLVTVERISYRECLTPVRAFYLDLAHWAVDDPGRWGRWVAPCPVGDEEINTRKAFRHRKSRMDARTRERLPVLPVVVRTVDRRRKTAAALLDAGRQAKPGETFSAAGTTLVRYDVDRGGPGTVWADDPATAKRRNLSREEDHAFWAWAIVEVLRATGIRVEELVELSHHSLVQYRLPTTGELVPLLQILPSKTDQERLLVVSPDLADVLSEIIRRNRTTSGPLPLLSAYDPRERVWSPRAPLLFQRRVGTEHRAIPKGTVGRLLAEALAHTGLRDVGDGGPLHYTPHDFRRMFITDAILNGLPPHIARSSPATATSTSPSATRPSTPKKPSKPTSASWPAADPCGPARNTGSPPTTSGNNFSGTSNGGKSPSEPAPGPSPPPASTNTPASAAPCCGPIPPSGPAWSTSPTTSPPASPKQNARAGRARSTGCRSA